MNRKVTPIDVDVDGVMFSCHYCVQADMLTVWHAYFGSRTRVFAGELESADVEALVIDLYQANRQRISSVSMGRA